jgi:hypothetical protein
LIGGYGGIETRQHVSLFDCLVDQIEIAPIALDAQPCDLNQYQLEVLEQTAQLGILSSRRVHQQSGGDEEIGCLTGKSRVGSIDRALGGKRDEESGGLSEVFAGLVAIGLGHFGCVASRRGTF